MKKKSYRAYDYDLQVWFDVESRIIQDCSHPLRMKRRKCCESHRLAGKLLDEVKVAPSPLMEYQP